MLLVLFVLFASLITLNLVLTGMVWLMYFYGRIVGIID